MKCEDMVEYLADGAGPPRALQRAVAEHAASCDECRHALRAVQALHGERERAVRIPRGGLERALAGSARPAAARSNGTVFWWGAGAGAALAASITLAVLVLWPSLREPAGTAAPEVMIALDDTEDVSITLDTPVELTAAEIRVTLNGAIELAGFGDQREVTWSTDLARGVNQLTLPVVVRGPTGGQLTVEVQHGIKRRQFVVDVRTAPSRIAGA